MYLEYVLQIPYQGEVLAKFTKDKVAAKTVAIMSNNSSDYSDGVANAFAKEAEAQGIEIVAKRRIFRRG